MNILDKFSLRGKTAVVTGGAGLYGRQIALALAQAGATTFMASRDLSKLQAQARKFQEQGVTVTPLQLDQSDDQSVNALLEKVVAASTPPGGGASGGVDILINNAVLRTMKDWSDTGESFAQSMAVNATGVFLMCRAFGEHMAARGRGSIVNIGSIQGMIGPDYTLYEGLDWGIAPDYFYHKGGMLNLTRFVASRLGPRGVRCNCLSPGGYYNNQDPAFVKRYNARTMLKRMADDTDLMGAIVFLASDASAYITGANLPVDAGYTAI